MAEMPAFSQNTIKELQTGLKEVLTKEELAKLTELMKERMEADAERRNRFRGGEGRQRGQRPSQ